MPPKRERFSDNTPDMDLVVLIDDPDAGLDPSMFVQMIGDLLERVGVSAI
jgi:terminal uridylyltransferase